MLVSKTLKFAFPPVRTLKFALPPTGTSDASQWNIGGVRSFGVGARVGHVHFYVVCVNFICFGYPTQTHFQWNMAFTESKNLY